MASSWPCGEAGSISNGYQLTVYDAAYLELAERTRLPLATLDGDLRTAALAASVVLLET